MKPLTTLAMTVCLSLVLQGCQGSSPTEPARRTTPDFLIGSSPLSSARGAEVDLKTDVRESALDDVLQLEATRGAAR